MVRLEERGDRMVEMDTLARITDKESVDNINEIVKCFIDHIDPLMVILFGSFADGTYTDESDYDFYLVVEDDQIVSDMVEAAYNAVLYVKNRPVDIIVGTRSRFERKRYAKHSLMIEGEVQRNGILLYDRTAQESSQRRAVV